MEFQLEGIDNLEDDNKQIAEFIFKFKEHQEKINYYIDYNHKQTFNVLNNNIYKKFYRQLIDLKY